MTREKLSELLFLAAAAAKALSDGLTSEEIGVLAQFFCVMGDALALLSEGEAGSMCVCDKS